MEEKEEVTEEKVQEEPAQEKNNPQKKWKKFLIVGVIALIIIAAGFCVWYFLIKNKENGKLINEEKSELKDEENEIKKTIYDYLEKDKYNIVTNKIDDELYKKQNSDSVKDTDEYKKITSYLNNKYGNNANFEILHINKYTRKYYGDGYAMGLDEKPEVILSTTTYYAYVGYKTNDYNIIFSVSFDVDNNSSPQLHPSDFDEQSGDNSLHIYNGISDDFVELLVDAYLNSQFRIIDENAYININNYNIMKKDSYGYIPELNELIVNEYDEDKYGVTIYYNDEILKNNDIYDYTKKHINEYIKFLKEKINTKFLRTLEVLNVNFQKNIIINFEDEEIYSTYDRSKRYSYSDMFN